MTLQRFPIIWKLGLHILVAGLCVVSIVIISIRGVGSLMGDGVAINYAGTERMRLYRLSLLLRQLRKEGDRTLRDEIEREIGTFERILMGLRYGDHTYNLRAVDNPDIVEKVRMCIHTWEERVKPIMVDILRGVQTEDGWHGFDTTISSFVRDIDSLVKSIEENSARKVKRYLVYQYILLLVILMVSVSSLVFIYRVISRPIKELIKGAHAIAGGDMSFRIGWDRRDEIGELARSFNTMAERLNESRRIILEREKLALLGTFCSGVAHEIRNPLSSVKMNLGILYRTIGRECDGELKEHFRIALREVDHMDKILRDILDFSRPGKLRISNNEIRDIIDASLNMAEGELADKAIEVVKDIEDGLFVKVDRGRITQALLNVYLNSIHAMKRGGRLRVSAFCREERVVIVVEDNGKGMSREVLSRIFEPFFTTRIEGTGLGMTLTRRIVEQHGGSIEVESAPGGGTKVIIDIPMVRQ